MKINELVTVKIEAENQKEDAVYASVEQSPFKIYGVFRENDGEFHRMPLAVAEKVSLGVQRLSTNTAGGRIKFKTDSPYVSVYVVLGKYEDRDHFTKLGCCGMDVYDGVEYKGSCRPGPKHLDTYHATVELGKGEHEITVNMPLYSNVREVYVGLKDGACVKEPREYTYAKEHPVVFYGSSITQGGCASRPGMSYQAILERELDFDYVNLGFSGNAKAEDVIIDYIAGLDMSVFVYDYDHNAPDPEHLEATHEKMFLAVRKAHPDIPVIFMSRPSFIIQRRREIVEKTYNNAIERGDKRVYIVKPAELNKKNATVDGCHPTDLGFYFMANDLSPILKRALEDSEK